MNDFIDLDEVKQQYSEINRPGDWLAISKESAPILSDNLIMDLNLPVVSMTFDRIRSSQPGVSLTAEKRISRAALYFADHFPKNRYYL